MRSSNVSPAERRFRTGVNILIGIGLVLMAVAAIEGWRVNISE